MATQILWLYYDPNDRHPDDLQWAELEREGNKAILDHGRWAAIMGVACNWAIEFEAAR